MRRRWPFTQNSVHPRVDSPPGTLEDQGSRGTGQSAIGALVQSHPTAGAHRLHTPNKKEAVSLLVCLLRQVQVRFYASLLSGSLVQDLIDLVLKRQFLLF